MSFFFQNSVKDSTLHLVGMPSYYSLVYDRFLVFLFYDLDSFEKYWLSIL